MEKNPGQKRKGRFQNNQYAKKSNNEQKVVHVQRNLKIA